MSRTNVSGLMLLQAVEQFQAVHARQLHVAQGDVEALLGGQGQRLLADAAGGDGEALLVEVLGQRVADQRLVVDDQDARRGPCRRRSAPASVRVSTMRRLCHGRRCGARLPAAAAGRRRRSGRRTRKTVPSPGRDSNVDRAAVVVHQLARHEQAQAGAVLLRREIGLEQPAGVLRRDAAAVVAHASTSTPPGRRVDAQLDPAVAVGGVDGVEDQVEEHLHELVAHADQRRQVRRQRAARRSGRASACNTWRCSAPRRGCRPGRRGRAPCWPAG